MTQSRFSTLILISWVRIMAIPSVSLVLCHSATGAGIVRACPVTGHLQKSRAPAEKAMEREITEHLCPT